MTDLIERVFYEGKGCAAIVKSLHRDEEAAEAACAALKGSVQ